MDNKARLFISLPGSSTFSVYEESPSFGLGFTFAPFSKNKKTIVLGLSETTDKRIPDVHSTRLNDFDSMPKEDYLELIDKTISHIKDNDLGKIVISRSRALAVPIENPLAVFQKVVAKYPNACVYLFAHPKSGLWLGATPELLLSKKGDGIQTVSLAGTMPKGQENSFTNKERDEQQQVTDFISKTFKSNPNISSVKIGEPKLYQAGNVCHYKTSISAKVSNDFDVDDFLSRYHPTPAVGGFPVSQALKFINDNEAHSREYYAGYFGLEVGGDFNYFVNLRCMQIVKDGIVLYAGGGITKDSRAIDEWNETEIKMQTLLQVIEDKI